VTVLLGSVKLQRILSEYFIDVFEKEERKSLCFTSEKYIAISVTLFNNAQAVQAVSFAKLLGDHVIIKRFEN
jgi:hypothetical protein